MYLDIMKDGGPRRSLCCKLVILIEKKYGVSGVMRLRFMLEEQRAVVSVEVDVRTN